MIKTVYLEGIGRVTVTEQARLEEIAAMPLEQLGRDADLIRIHDLGTCYVPDICSVCRVRAGQL